ncbi:MAG TPA: phosphopyruvate hydratase [Candidatus Moranbacteria bacterium]|nr:phosphopyruvate hydratase [Candidatus Moranbacteria bacterium]
MKIKSLQAREILDSRANPTVEVKIILENGAEAKAAVPSGASTGENEALELRDNNEERYGGKGVLTACQNIIEKIYPSIRDFSVFDQQKVDQKMLEIDGTKNKSTLGANAILAVSLSVARAAANARMMPLWKYLQEKFEIEQREDVVLPALMMNVINGGAHADSGLDFQEYMIVVDGFDNFSERLRAGTELYHALGKELKGRGFKTAVGDEGGFAPALNSNEEPLELMTKIINESSFVNQGDVQLGMDVAASEFFDGENYKLTLEEETIPGVYLAKKYEQWLEKYKIRLIEDPFSEKDWESWKAFTNSHENNLTLIGDDLLVTQKQFLTRAIEEKACNAILIKVNQVGSLTETMETIKLAKESNFKIAVSHRSGETWDDFIADLAIATQAEFVKFGAPARTERSTKYNRLAEIALDLGK